MRRIGTGITSDQLKQKIKVLNQSKQFHGPINEIYEVLQTFGGFEIVQMCSAMLESYENNMTILVDEIYRFMRLFSCF